MITRIRPFNTKAQGSTIALAFMFSFIFVIFLVLFVFPSDDTIETKEVIPKGWLKGQIESLSPVTENNNCNIIFVNDLTMYILYDVNDAQWKILNVAKDNQQTVAIEYEEDEEGLYHIKSVGIGTTIPQPPKEETEFAWWIIWLPIGVMLVVFVGPKVVYFIADWYEEKDLRKREKEKKKQDKIKKEQIKKEKRAKKVRAEYQRADRTSRESKAAQLLDELENKKRRL